MGPRRHALHEPTAAGAKVVAMTDELRTDELYMEEALRSAQRALEMGEVPIGAIVVHDSKIIARGYNLSVTTNDPTAHAEILALREAGTALGNYRLTACTLFVTIEPCSMCAGALAHARVGRVVYGAKDPKTGADGSVLQVLNHPAQNHHIEVQAGVLAARCAELLQSFFRERRSEHDR
jgi:tRNA(adenine34) deaminase